MATQAQPNPSDPQSKIAELQRRLAEAEAALEASEARILSLGQRVDSYAHDLNNLFAPIIMAAGLLRQKVTDEKGLRMVTVLEENAERGANLVRHMQTPEAPAGPARPPAPAIAPDDPALKSGPRPKVE